MLSRRVKNQVLRMISGFLLLPLGVILVLYNENKAAYNQPVFNGLQEEWIYWAIRLAGFIFISFCLYRIFSAIKLFMMQIPLTYNEIRAGIFITAILTGLLLTCVCISIIRIYHQPMISLILVGVSAILMVLLLIRRGQKKKQDRSQLPSSKPHQAKDV